MASAEWLGSTWPLAQEGHWDMCLSFWLKLAFLGISGMRPVPLCAAVSAPEQMALIRLGRCLSKIGPLEGQSICPGQREGTSGAGIGGPHVPSLLPHRQEGQGDSLDP